MATASVIIAEENYSDVQQWIYRTVHDFISKVIMRSSHTKGIGLGDHDGWFEEALSEAHLAYVRCEKKYDPTKGSFTNWVRRNVWYGLLDWWRAFIDQSNRFSSIVSYSDEDGEADNSSEIEDRSRFFNTDWLLNQLSEDAQFLAKLVIDDATNPGEWDWLFCGSEWRNETGLPDCVVSARKAVRQRLTDLGWPKGYIKKTWEEIQMVLWS